MIMEKGSVYSGETEAREKSEAMVGVKNLEKVGGKWEEEASTLVDLGERSANGRQSTLENGAMPWRREAVRGNCGSGGGLRWKWVKGSYG